MTSLSTKDLRVFVTDGRTRSSLQIVRSLGRAGAHVFLGESKFCGSSTSRFVSKFIQYPDYKNNPKNFIKLIEDFTIKKSIDLIIPVRSEAVKLFLHNEKKFKHCEVFLPDNSSFTIFNNKKLTVSESAKLKIPIPKTIVFDKSINYSYLNTRLGSKIIAKPAVGSGSRGIFLIKSNIDFEAFKQKKETNDYIFQEFIPNGGAVGVYSLYKKGKLLAKSCHLRLREYPISGGPSTFRVSIKHKKCEELSEKLLEHFNYDEVAMVEFRLSKNNRIPYLMEVNPRFWGSLALDIVSGVDFPKLIVSNYYDFLDHQKVDRKKGIYCRWLFFGDILWLFSHPQKIYSLKKFLSFGNQYFDVLDFKDPLPVLGMFGEALVSLFSKETRLHIFNRGFNHE